jgi:hypothetical protein
MHPGARPKAPSDNDIHAAAFQVEDDEIIHESWLPSMMFNKSIAQDWITPWQQVMMVFARTQVPHQWESPRYPFTERQQQAWDRLWNEALRWRSGSRYQYRS